jgi:CBS domain-containing protein
MKVRELMTENPACCSPDTSLQEVAKLMVDCDCGEIPVADDQGKPLGVITDRDIACRAVAKGLDTRQTHAQEIMTSPAITIDPEASLDECCQRMDDNQIRRIPVVDSDGAICGIVAQADIARAADEQEAGHLVRDISQPSSQASRLSG